MSSAPAPSPAVHERGIRTLALGTLVAQAVALAATPLLTRLFAPAEFGAYAQYLSLVSVLAPVAALRFDAAVPLPHQDEEATAVVGVGVLAALLVATLAALLLGMLTPWLTMDAAAQAALRWMPVGLFAAGCFQLGAAWRVRIRAHGTASAGRAVQGLATAVLQAVTGALGRVADGLPFGDVIGRGLAAGTVMRRLPLTFSMLRDATAIRRLVHRYRGFATWATLAALLFSLHYALPVFVIGASLGLEATGWFLMAQRVITIPGVLLVTATQQVFAVELARSADAAARVALFNRTLWRLLRVAGPAVLGIGALAPLLMGPLLGHEWQHSGWMTAVLAPWALSLLLSGALMSAVDVHERHRTRCLLEIGTLVVLVIALRITVSHGVGALATVAVVAGVGTAASLVSLLWLRQLVRRGGGVSAAA